MAGRHAPSDDAAGARLVIRSSGAADTRAAGATLARALLRAGAAGTVIALLGPLGAGKTCFVQGLAAALGVTGPVRSPTFVLVCEYRGAVPLYHVDLYRLSPSDLDALGLEEIFDGRGVAAVEWAEHAGAALPAEHLRIEMAYGPGEDDRVLQVTARGDRYERVLKEFAACAFSG